MKCKSDHVLHLPSFLSEPDTGPRLISIGYILVQSYRDLDKMVQNSSFPAKVSRALISGAT